MNQNPSRMLAQHLARVPLPRGLIRTLEQRLFAEHALESPVLDIGCGDGHYAAVAFSGGLDIGIDISFDIVNQSLKNGPYRGLSVADGTHMPFADASFRTIVSNCVIEHVPDIERLVAEVARTLTPGGKFIFSVPNDHFTDMLFTVRTLRRLGLGRLADRYGRWWNNNAVHHHLDSSAVWRARLARHSLTVARETEYMSETATRAFELSSYYAVPSIVWHRFTGRWSVSPDSAGAGRAFRWLEPHARESWPQLGSCTFYVAAKR